MLDASFSPTIDMLAWVPFEVKCYQWEDNVTPHKSEKENSLLIAIGWVLQVDS